MTTANFNASELPAHIPAEFAKRVVNEYVGFPIISKFVSGTISLFLIIVVVCMAISFSYFVQSNLDPHDWRRMVAFSSFTIILTILLCGMLVRLSYDLVDISVVLGWAFIFIVMYTPVLYYLYYLEDLQKNTFGNKFVKYYSIAISILGIVMAGSPLSCQIANILFNYTSEPRKSIVEKLLAEVFDVLSLTNVEKISKGFKEQLQNLKMKND